MASATNGAESLMVPIVAAVKSLAILGEVRDTVRAARRTYDEGPSTR